MANKSGNIYGLTILSPIRQDPHAQISPSLAIRSYLQTLPNGSRSPFAKVSGTHMARLVVMDDVVFEGYPSHEEHLRDKYLVFESNFDGDLDDYLRKLASEVPSEVEGVWQHCRDFPGVKDSDKFVAYMKRCQVTTTFFFADVNNKTVDQTLWALEAQSAVAEFVEKNQGKPAEEIQSAFVKFVKLLRATPPPPPGSGHGKEFTDRLI